MYTTLDFTLALLGARAELEATIEACIKAEDRYNAILEAEGIEAADDAEGDEVSRLQRRIEALQRLIPCLEEALRKTEDVEATEA